MEEKKMTNIEAVKYNDIVIFQADDVYDPTWDTIISVLKEHIPGFKVGYGNENWMAFALPKDNEEVYDETQYTHWVAIKLLNKDNMPDLTEHLAMNGYTFDTNGNGILFVAEDEITYVITIMKDHGVEFEPV